MVIPRSVLEQLHSQLGGKYSIEFLNKVLKLQFEFFIEEMRSGRNNNILLPYMFKAYIPNYKRIKYGY